MTNEDVPAYIARCKCGCGSLVFASVDEPGASKETRKDTAEAVAEMIRDGYSVERMKVGEVRKAEWGCRNKAKRTG